MREIKFRAWNKKRKRMYEVLHLHMPTIMNGGIWATVKGYDIIEDKDIHIQIQPEHIEVMQFTGLKDKNGKEIYEGDILHVWGGAYAFGCWEVDEKTVLENYVEDTFSLSFAENMEVIGNIYENPKLLEGNTP